MLSVYERDKILQDFNQNVAIAESANQRRAELLTTLNSRREILNKLYHALQCYKDLLEKCKNGIHSYKEERLSCLTQQVQDNLNLIYPGDNFNVKFESTTFRNKEVINFYTGRGNKLAPMKMQNGRLFRQIASFSITTMIQILEGCELLIMDEAINSGDPESTSDVAKLLSVLINSGYQIILIEHKEELYGNLPRVQYDLVRDRKTNKVSEVVRSDFEE